MSKGGLKYVGGVVTVKNINVDKLSVLELIWYTIDFRYPTVDGVYYKPKGTNEFILLNSNGLILEVAKEFKD